MARIDLDYAHQPGTGRWLGAAILIVAVIAGVKQADLYLTARREINQLDARIARIESRGAPGRPAALSEATVREIRRANDVIEQIALPWDHLFRAVESSTGSKIALLGITPDQKSGTVEVAGEAADLNALFDYVKRLQEQPALSRVFLLNQKLNDQDAQRPIRFTLSASWLDKKRGS